MIRYSENIKAPIDIIWQDFIYKIEHPENFVPGVSNVSIKENNDAYTLREMDIKSHGGLKVRLIEKITYSPYCIRFLDHPLYSGYVDNIAKKIQTMKQKLPFL